MAEAAGKTPQQAAGKKRGLSAPVAIVLGLIKGGALGAGAAYLATRGILPVWILAAIVGVLAGAVAGRAPWRGAAWIATILKAAIGFLVGWGGYKLVVWLGVQGQPWIWLPALGALWSLLIEIDDAVGSSDEPEKKPSAPAS
jgi:uncharacterized MAPEG superfamily protein